MGVRAETQEEIRNEKITKIFGQPTKHNITKMEKELTAIAAGIPSNLGGGNHSHAGIIVENTKYITMTGRTAFVTPANPGLYPAIAATITSGTRAREEALHKGLVKEYKIFCGVEAGLKDIILEAVDNNYVLEIKDKIVGFLNQTPKQIIAHSRNRGGQLDFADTKKLIGEQDSEWDRSKIPQVYFNSVKKAMKQLKRAGIASDLNKRRDMALYYLKTTGEYDPAVREWEYKTAADKMWANIKVFISKNLQKKISKPKSQQNNSKQTSWMNRQKSPKN
jgi:hypothetical protein